MTPVVVQSVCPNCKKVLRIPAEWLDQAMKCKFCGLLMQARARPKAGVPVPAPAPLSQTPRPAPRGDIAPSPLPVAIPVRPLPVATPAAGSPFSELPFNPPPKRRRGGSWWKGALLMLCVVGLAGAVAFVAGPQIAEMLKEPAAGTEVADKGPDTKRDDLPAPRETKKETEKETKKEPPPSTKKEETKKDDPPPPKETKKKPDPSPPPPDTKKETKKGPTDLPEKIDGPFPRRALVIAVSNYLYFNPTVYGMPVLNANSVNSLITQLNRGLSIPLNQVMQLSDAAPLQPQPPLKNVINSYVQGFLGTSRPQDRIMVLFVGHYVEIDDDVFLVPIDGDRDVKDTLIPLSSIYKAMEACPARQKVLVLDVCRFNPTRGLERPGSGIVGEEAKGVLGPKLDAMLKAPPAGVEVVSACSMGEYSYEYDNAFLYDGMFIDAMHEVLRLGQLSQGKIQTQKDLMPTELLVEKINAHMKAKLGTVGKKQTAQLFGTPADTGADFDPKEPPPPKPVIVLPPAADLGSVREVMRMLDVPPLKITRAELALKAESMPLFDAKILAKYPLGGEETPFRKAIKDAVKAINDNVRGKQLQEEFGKPANYDMFKANVLTKIKRDVAVAQSALETEALPALEAAGKDREAETSQGWQACYDYVLARLKAQIAYMYEYQSALGQMGKELPPMDEKVHNGWRLASQPALQGDREGKKLASASRKLLDEIIKNHPGTPWEVLAKRDKLTTLGLEWQATRIGANP